jgi:AhpC/TSA family
MRPLCPACHWVNGEAPDLEGLRGRPVLVLFWSTSDQVALRQISRIEQWIQRRGFPLEVVSVHTPLQVVDMDPNRVIAVIRENDIHHPVALDGDDGALADAYDVRDLPAYYHFDAELRLRKKREGTGAVAAMDRLMERAS